jgi:hypothetical protein
VSDAPSAICASQPLHSTHCSSFLVICFSSLARADCARGVNSRSGYSW